MRFGRVRGLRRAGGVGGVEIGVEGQGVVLVALQRPDAVMMGGTEGVGDRVGEQRVGADLDEGGVLLAGGGDGLAEPHRIAQVGRPVVGVEHRRRADAVKRGGDDRDGRGLRRQIRPARCAVRAGSGR